MQDLSQKFQISVVYLKKHERIHTGEKLFHCKICPKKFNDSSNLRKHEKIHKDAKQFQCSSCEKSFRRSSALLFHKFIHSEN